MSSRAGQPSGSPSQTWQSDGSKKDPRDNFLTLTQIIAITGVVAMIVVSNSAQSQPHKHLKMIFEPV
jgi:hypothetical protein